MDPDAVPARGPRGSIASALGWDWDECQLQAEEKVSFAEASASVAMDTAKAMLEVVPEGASQPEPQVLEEVATLLQGELDALGEVQKSVQQHLGAAKAAGKPAADAALVLVKMPPRLRHHQAAITVELNRIRGKPAAPQQQVWRRLAAAPGVRHAAVPAVLPIGTAARRAAAAAAQQQQQQQQPQQQGRAAPLKLGRQQGPLPRYEGPAPQLEGVPVPRVAIFDLDETCWTHFGLDHKSDRFQPPFRWCEQLHAVVDAVGKAVKILPELPSVLRALHHAGVQIAVASHDTQAVWCGQVMDSLMLDEGTGLSWGDLVPQELRVIRCSGEYWPGKKAHLRDIQLHCGCEYRDMVFFDDGNKNCALATKLGAGTARCQGGMTIAKLWEGLESWAMANGLNDARDKKRARHGT